jgi:hypothetical protein
MWTSGAATVGTTYLFLHPEVLGLPQDTDWKLLGHAIIRGLKLAATVVLIVSDYQAPKLLAFLGISGYVGWMDDPCRAWSQQHPVVVEGWQAGATHRPIPLLVPIPLCGLV